MHDADILGVYLHRGSDSQSFLRVLAFEVLLKAALLSSRGADARGHKYKELWTQLPEAVRARIMSVAVSRSPGHTDFSNVEKLLVWYQYIFAKARYSYEIYDGYTPEEMRELGTSWEEIGAPVEEAVIQYWHEELYCLTEGLLAYVEEAL
ncbi:MAG: hypothetical protein H7255_15965 [Ramlibacter sp.]|nr:hypothetical protein [Ramlibacter sp.]